MTTIQRKSDTSSPIRPIQFIEVGGQPQIPAPFLRVTTCGLLTIEIVAEVVSTDPPLARYTSLTPEQLRGRGTTPALTLLKLLLNRHAHFASKDWLLEQFCRDGEQFASARIENIVSLLRGLICPPAYQDLRTHLVAHVRSSISSGDGYQLAQYPLIWVDGEALAWNVEQATRMERFGDDGLPFWERAYALAKRGPYLPDEMYSEWATFRRGEVQGLLRQSVQALARLYVARHGAAGEEEALLLLRSFWQEHPHEEDVLRALMELLGRRECYHEALQYYERLCTLLEQEDRTPNTQTQDVAIYFQTKQIQRSKEPLNTTTTPLLLPPSPRRTISNLPVEQVVAQDRQMLLIPEDQERDILLQRKGQQTSDVAGTTFVSSLLFSSTEVLERLARVLVKSTHIDETTLFVLEQRVRECWRFRPDILGMISPDLVHILLKYLQEVTTLLAGSLLPSIRIRLCALTCELTQIIGWTLYEMRAFSQAQMYYEMALLAAREAGNPLLEAVTLARMSRVFKYCAREDAVLPALQHARRLLHEENTSPTYSWLCAEEALAYARNGQEYKSLKILEQAIYVGQPQNMDDDPYWIGFEENVRAGFLGSCYTALHQFEQAKASYEEALVHIRPSSRIHAKHRRSLLLVNLATLLLQEEAIEQACQYSKEALILVNQSRSPLVLQHLVKFQRKLSPWKLLAEVELFQAAFEHVQLSVSKESK